MDAAIAGSCGENGTIELGLNVNDCTLEDASGDFLPGIGIFGDACVNIPGGADVVDSDACYHAMSYSGTYLAS